MKESTPMGMNKTGMQMSPLDSGTMQSPPPSTISATPGDESAVADMRGSYVNDADSLGSVPVPATMTGAVSAGMSMLSGNSPQILLDKLGERLAFERGGTRLYDALIAKCEAMPGGSNSNGIAIDELWKIRNDEARHFAVVVDAIESLGGDPTAQTPSADLVGVESMGLVQVVTDPRTTIAQSLHAILAAELVDQAGWEMLLAMAKSQNQNAMLSEFSIALDEERDHLQKVKTWYEEAVMGTSYPGGTSAGNANTPTRH
ncbi:MAG: ferritin Dps family protein [Burkholderiales bacterium RIFCSPLOWO2_02_FULL_57_36]|nr:MAG: ferritin Dps family protein [Burkholderiales bacterium RIFCSPLOWO2_02_FULL_57_36]